MKKELMRSVAAACIGTPWVFVIYSRDITHYGAASDIVFATLFSIMLTALWLKIGSRE